MDKANKTTLNKLKSLGWTITKRKEYYLATKGAKGIRSLQLDNILNFINR